MGDIEYDLDTSGGLMDQIQALLAPPTNEQTPPKNGKEVSKHPYYKRPGKGHNHDSCDACTEGGDLICCDKCPASFHLQCYDPPLEESDIPQGQWLCHTCRTNAEAKQNKASSNSDDSDSSRKRLRNNRQTTTNNNTTSSSTPTGGTTTPPSSNFRHPKKPKPIPLEVLLQAARVLIPKQFELPNALTVPCPFPGTDKNSKVCSLYETVVKQDPTNEELHTHLFMSSVRILDFKQQQQAAMALYKLKQKNLYYFWAIMSVVLQATRDPNNDEKKAALLLSLAERMVDKLLNENRIEAEQELQLYLMILKLQNKNEEALQLLNSPLGNRLLTGASTHARIPFLINLNKWHQINTLCSKMLIENMDAWNIWKYYLQSVFELMKMKDSEIKDEINVEGNVNVDDSPEKCHDFICTLMECCSNSGPTVRGPWLARLELYLMMQERNYNPKEILGDYLELLVEYFRKFGHKPCCVYDMRVYIKHLPISRRSDLSSKLLKDVGINSTTLPQSKQQMFRHISSLQLSRLCGAHENLNKSHLSAFVTALALHYQHGADTYSENLLPTDPGPADPYALLSAHVLFDISVRERSSMPLIWAISILDKLLKASPANHHAKLLCLRLYHCLGAGHAAHQYYESLDIKHIQLDSVGHLHAAQLPVTGPLSLHSQLCNATCTFFTTNYKDTADYLTFSYKFGSFLKLEEILDFRERLNNSLHKFLCFTEKKFLDLINCTSLTAVNSINFDENNNVKDYDLIRDNRDLNAIVSFDPITLTEELHLENKIAFDQEKEVIRLRTAMYHYILAAIKIPFSTEKERFDAVERTQNYKKNYENIYSTIETSNQKPIVMSRLAGQFSSRLHSQLTVPYKEILNSFFDLIHALVTSTDDSNAENVQVILTHVQKVQQKLKIFTDDICNTIKEHQSSEDFNYQKRKIVEKVTNVVELTCITTLLCSACCELAKPCQGRKSKKKGTTTSPTSVIWSQLKSLVTSLKTHIESFDKSLQNWSNPSQNDTISALADRLNAMYLSDSCVQDVLSKINVSHITMLKDIHNLLKEKLKMLSSYL